MRMRLAMVLLVLIGLNGCASERWPTTQDSEDDRVHSWDWVGD